MPRAISRCPGCREPVSPFAAGCAICGTDLESARADLAARRAKRPQLRAPGYVSDDAIRYTVAVVAAVFSPFMGALLTGWFAYDADQNGRVTVRNVMLGLLALSVLGMYMYNRLWGWLILGIG